jgi:hypothetical protein
MDRGCRRAGLISSLHDPHKQQETPFSFGRYTTSSTMQRVQHSARVGAWKDAPHGAPPMAHLPTGSASDPAPRGLLSLGQSPARPQPSRSTTSGYSSAGPRPILSCHGHCHHQPIATQHFRPPTPSPNRLGQFHAQCSSVRSFRRCVAHRSLIRSSAPDVLILPPRQQRVDSTSNGGRQSRSGQCGW